MRSVLDPTLCLTLSVSALYTLYTDIYDISKTCRAPAVATAEQFCQCFSMQKPGIVILVIHEEDSVGQSVTI